MLKVMLVKKFSGTTTNVGYHPLGTIPHVGDEFEVSEFHKENGKEYYVLTIQGRRAAFDPANFAILPGLTAEEMNELEKEAIIK